MQYTTLTIHQRIALKGFIKNPKSRPAFFKAKEHNYFDALAALWMFYDFRTAVEQFLITE
jgi:hypothetical protein